MIEKRKEVSAMLIPVFVSGFVCGFVGFAFAEIIVLFVAYKAGKNSKKE